MLPRGRSSARRAAPRWRAGCRPRESPMHRAVRRRRRRHLELRAAARAADHRAPVGPPGNHGCAEEVFEARQLRDGLPRGRLGHSPACRRRRSGPRSSQRALAERKDLPMRVCYADVDLVRLVPRAQVLDDERLCGVVEGEERLVEEQHRQVPHERPGRAARCRSPPEASDPPRPACGIRNPEHAPLARAPRSTFGSPF